MGRIEVDARSFFIMKQSSLKSASTFLSGKDVGAQEVLAVADLFLDWVLDDKAEGI